MSRIYECSKAYVKKLMYIFGDNQKSVRSKLLPAMKFTFFVVAANKAT